MTGLQLDAYEAAHLGAAFFPLPEGGYLRISGSDQASFLQRQTSNDMRLLKPGRALLNVLTSPTARILDVFYLLQEADAIGVLTLPGRGARTASFLRSRIFFMDKVSLSDASAEWAQLDLLGPGAAGVLHQLGLASIPGLDQAHTFQYGEIQGSVLASHPALGMGFRLLIPETERDALLDALRQAGAPELDAATFRILRVEAGLPGAANELSEEYTPLECGLKNAISENKGCYTGQEIIARQITYDKVTQQLCGLRLEADASPGDRVYVEDRAVGSLTSAADSPRFGRIALGIMKRPFFQPGTQVTVNTSQGKQVAAEVTPLPFGSGPAQ